jgi:hypothetical protein
MFRGAAAVVLVAALAAVAVAQIPARCASPRQWAAQAFVRDSEKGQSHMVLSRYYYDEVNQRKARFDQVDPDRKNTTFYYVVELYQEKKEYIFNPQTRQCTVRATRRPFIPHSVVDNATFEGEYYIGTSSVAGAGVEVEAWSHDFTNDQGEKFHWVGEFTRSRCIPVESHVEGPGFFFYESFYDVVIGIPDPNVFIPPPECNQ